jgi:hypothetical protein
VALRAWPGIEQVINNDQVVPDRRQYIVHHGEHQVVEVGAAVQISQGVPSELLDFPGRNGMWRWGTYNLEGHTPDFSKGGAWF